MTLCHCMTLFPMVSIYSRFVHNKPKVWLMHSCKHAEQYKKNYYFTCTKHNCTSAKCMFNWNTSVSNNKQQKVCFPPPKALSRSTEISTVTICTFVVIFFIFLYRLQDQFLCLCCRQGWLVVMRYWVIQYGQQWRPRL
jgi:hypothetical protein